MELTETTLPPSLVMGAVLTMLLVVALKGATARVSSRPPVTVSAPVPLMVSGPLAAPLR